MRLRLVVRRHNLPDTAVVWATEPGEDPTISQLLEQVNEVIPLESGGDWGLEDYSVEIKGSGTNFECLHFQLVGTILHEDDEVLIRPLLSQDFKLRRVSGRHQISSDGRHLFDGSVFGRPRPRGLVDRPSISIPPRKRRRITYDEDADTSLDGSLLAIEGELQLEDDQNGNRQLVLSADFDDDDEEDDEDYEPGEDEVDEQDVEFDIEEGSERDGHRGILSEEDENSSSSDIPADVQDEEVALLLANLQEAFPDAPISICKHVLYGCDGDVVKAWEILTKAFKPSKPRKVVETLHERKSSLAASSRSKANMTSLYQKRKWLEIETEKNVGDDDGHSSSSSEDGSIVNYYDQHGLPEGSIGAGEALLHMAEASRTPKKSIIRNERTSGSDTPKPAKKGSGSVRFAKGKNADELVLSESDENARAKTISTDNDDSSDESSIDVDDESSSSSEGIENSSSDSSSESSSDSDSDSDGAPDEVSSRPAKSDSATKSVASEPQTSAKNAPSKTIDSQTMVPPGKGKKATRNRNQRRRKANILNRFKNKGILPAGTTLEELARLDMNRIRTPEDALAALSEIRADSPQRKNLVSAATKAAEFESKRQELLASLASGGVEVGSQPMVQPSTPPLLNPSLGPEMSETLPEPSVTLSVATAQPGADVGTLTTIIGLPKHKAAGPAATPVFDPTKTSTVSPGLAASGSTSSRPRKKLDMGAAGRLLFGALGIKAPKTEADRDRVRQDLEKDIRPVKPASTVESATEETCSLIVHEDLEAWREVISLRAVECCHEDVELAPPPFPFVQRWDPQQQGNFLKRGNRGGKGKKYQRNQSQFYETEQSSASKRPKFGHFYDDSYDQHSMDVVGDSIRDAYYGENEAGAVYVNGTLNVHSDGIEGAINEQIMRDVQEAETGQAFDEDDLPGLPSEVSSLSDLTVGDAKTGMVIAFKQLILSEATNWQPQISHYRTAVVIKAAENSELELTLAKRDREQRRWYDEETGERLYGKFDMPDEDDDEEEDDGFLNVTFTELVEPKIVQMAPENLQAFQSVQTLQNKANVSTDDSTTLGHENSPQKLKASVGASRSAEIEEDEEPEPPIDGQELLSAPGDKPADDFVEDMVKVSVSEDTRDEISELIKVAGFRSSIPSSVLRAQPMLPGTPEHDPEEDPSYSPKFNGFGSSPSIQPISSPALFAESLPAVADSHSQAGNDDVPENKSTISSIHYPKLNIPWSLASHTSHTSQVSDRGRQPDYPTPGDDTLHQFDDAESFLGNREDEHTVEGPLGGLLSPSYNPPSSDAVSSPATSEPSSSAGLPSLDEAFLTALSSIVPKLEESDLNNKVAKEGQKQRPMATSKAMGAKERLEVTLGAATDADQVTPKASQNHREIPWTRQTTSQSASGSQFVIPPGSQQVDLTLSSDVEADAEKENEGDGSYDNNFGLPKGPGWVKKKGGKVRRQTTANTRASSQGEIRTRSSRRRTLSKF